MSETYSCVGDLQLCRRPTDDPRLIIFPQVDDRGRAQSYYLFSA